MLTIIQLALPQVDLKCDVDTGISTFWACVRPRIVVGYPLYSQVVHPCAVGVVWCIFMRPLRIHPVSIVNVQRWFHIVTNEVPAYRGVSDVACATETNWGACWNRRVFRGCLETGIWNTRCNKRTRDKNVLVEKNWHKFDVSVKSALLMWTWFPNCNSQVA